MDRELTSALVCGRPAASGERAPCFVQQFKPQARVKSTPFLATRSHSRWQGELHNSHSSLQILLTSQPTSFPSLREPLIASTSRKQCVLSPAASHIRALHACARIFGLPPSLRHSEGLLLVSQEHQLHAALTGCHDTEYQQSCRLSG